MIERDTVHKGVECQAMQKTVNSALDIDKLCPVQWCECGVVTYILLRLLIKQKLCQYSKFVFYIFIIYLYYFIQVQWIIIFGYFKHAFHQCCIQRWLSHDGAGSLCPLDRRFWQPSRFLFIFIFNFI